MELFKVTMMPAMNERHYYIVAKDMGEAQILAEKADSIEGEPGYVQQVVYIGRAKNVLLGATISDT